MPISVVCPQCGAKLNAPDSAAGKRVKCPKCQTAMLVPEPLPASPEFEVVDEAEAEPVQPKKPVAKPRAVKAVAEVDDDEDDRPVAKPRAVKAVAEVDDDEDDRPRAKRRPR